MRICLFLIKIEIDWWQEWDRFNLRLTVHWDLYPGIFISFPRRHR